MKVSGLGLKKVKIIHINKDGKYIIPTTQLLRCNVTASNVSMLACM